MEVLKQVLLFTVSLYMNIIVLLIYQVQFSVLLPYFCGFVKFTHRIYICTEMNKWTYQLSSCLIWFVSIFGTVLIASCEKKKQLHNYKLPLALVLLVSILLTRCYLSKKINGGNLWQKSVGSIATGPYNFWAGFLLNPLPTNAKILCQEIFLYLLSLQVCWFVSI
mgnify:CR=1 FL=1